jgi:ribonuclease R
MMRDRLLELLEQTGKPLSVRELVRRLDLSGAERRELKTLLRRLIEDGEVVKIRGARIGLPARMSLQVGRLSCSPSGYGFVIPERRDPKVGDVFIAGAHLKQALHGDRVVARIERITAKGREGRIIRVLERALGRVVGRYEDDGRFGGHVVPFDRRVLHEVFIPAGDEAGASSGEMVTAELTRPPTATRNPVGRVVQVIGRLEEPGVDLKVVMAKHGLPDAFPEEVAAEAERVPRQVRAEDVAGREDYRALPTVTIDPETARDHDDAISLEPLGSSGFRLYVHIADVAHYVPEGSLIDQEAYLRGTSVYFPDRVVPMLPEALSSHICSLVEGEDRLCQTVVLDLDQAGRVERAGFHDGVIRSAARLAYAEVQAVLDGDQDARLRLSPLVPLLERMDALAHRMREQRCARGSLDLDLPEPKLRLDDSGEILEIQPAPRLDSQRLIEEFMLAANEAVAQRLSEAGVGALYRVHERPDPERIEEFRELAESFGYRLPDNLETIRPEDFQLILRQIEGKPEQKLISYLLLRTMKLARYHEENLGHFGLATSMYAHFTSPIRRYPDLVVHRALRGLRKGASEEREPRLPEALPEMGVHLSKTEQTAAEAERELVEWKKVRFMAGRLGETFRGYVTGVQAFGLFVELEEIYVQGLVHVSSMSDDYYRLNEKAHCLIGENTRRCYRLGDHVEVQVARVDLDRRQVDFALVDVLERASARRQGSPRPKAPSGRPRRPQPRGRRRT